MNEPEALRALLSHRLLRLGTVLFLLGLLTGFVVPALANPRMALSSHLEAVQNGMLLMILGLAWTRLRLTPRLHTAGFWLAVYGAFTNWATTLVAAAWGAGASMMPHAGGAHRGSAGQEAIIAFGLVSLSVAMVAVAGIVLYGLRGGPAREAA